jgi:Rod binding domain-containing protein
MTPTTIGSLTPAQHKPDVDAASEPSAEQRKAAREFEAIFIRQLLASLEKGSGLSGGESSGGSVFRSMMVSALADTAAEGGGIGLSELISRAMMPPLSQGKADLSAPERASQTGAFHSGEAPARSARLGVAGRTLTEARSPTILGELEATQGAAPLSRGDVR